MRMLKISTIMIAMTMMLFACATVSETKLKLAQQSMQQGHYNQAFDHAILSLQSKIDHYDTIVLLPSIKMQAYAQKQSQIAAYKAAKDWDSVAYAYDRIISMNQSLQSTQRLLAAFILSERVADKNKAAIDRLLAVPILDVKLEHDRSYKYAAEAHYMRGKQDQLSKAYRQSNTHFMKALSFITPYKDARERADTTKNLADMADAKHYYNQAKQHVRTHSYRSASRLFGQSESYIHGYKDAYQLAEKYKSMADLADALIHYNSAQALALQKNYRTASAEFGRALSFIPNYKDAVSLEMRYRKKADKQDALKHYQRANTFMGQQRFKQAAMEFDAAERFVSGFKDARYQAEYARSLVPPSHAQLQALVQRSVANGVPLSWLHDVHQGYSEHVVIHSIQVLRQGRFNLHKEYWPYRLNVSGVTDLEVPNAEEQKITFTRVVDFRIFRDDFGGWKATFR